MKPIYQSPTPNLANLNESLHKQYRLTIVRPVISGEIIMIQLWAIQDAKARLSELVKKAQKDGPQYISVRGEPAVVVISQREYQTLTTPAISI